LSKFNTDDFILTLDPWVHTAIYLVKITYFGSTHMSRVTHRGQTQG